MHLRAATLAIVVCGMMIGTLAAQYAQQEHDHAQSSATNSRQNAADQQDQRRRFSLWDALTGGRSRSAPPPRQASRPPVYQGNRTSVQPQEGPSSPPEQTPVSQFGPPQNRGGRRPLGAHSDDNEPAVQPAPRREVRQPVQQQRDTRQQAQQDYAPVRETQQQEEERPGFMYPLLDFLGNRHRAPRNSAPANQSQRSAPRANTAFPEHRPQASQQERKRGLRALIPDAIANGRPGPLPMNAGRGDSGEPQLADSPTPQPQQDTIPRSQTRRPPEVHASQNRFARNPRFAPPQPRQPQRSLAETQPRPPQPSSSEPQLPPNMASAEIRSPRLGPSDAELGILPPAAEDLPSASGSIANDSPTLQDQPLVRVKKPQQQNNAALKSLAQSYRQRNAAASAPKTYEDWLQRGKSLAIEEQFVEAVDAYTKAIELDPYGLEAYGNRGLAYRERKMFREAVYDFNIVLRMKPELAKAYYDRAETYRLAGKLEKAARDYEESIRLKPDFALAHAQYGAMLMSNGEFEDAVEILDAAIALDESDKLSIYDRGLAKAMRGDFQAALQDFESLQDPTLDGSSWETMLTRLRRPGEPMTTVELAPAVGSLAQASPNDQLDDLSKDPFFSGAGSSHSSGSSRREPTVAPSQVAEQPTASPRRFPQSSDPQRLEQGGARNPVVQTQPSPSAQEPAENQTQPEQVTLAPPVQQDAEPREKPMRIVLGGGSTKLDRDRTSFVRVGQPAELNDKLEPVAQQPENRVAEPTRVAAQPVRQPESNIISVPQRNDESLLETNSLWTTPERNMAASRAARRGDGSLFKIITRQESVDSDAADPFAFAASGQSNKGVGTTIRPSREKKDDEQSQPTQVATTSQPKPAEDAKPAVAELEFDGVALPNPDVLTTMSAVDAAIKQYNDAILRRPRFAPYYEARARLWLKQERRTAALTDLRQAVRLDGSLTAAKTAKDKLEEEIAADLARQQELLRTANRSRTGNRRR